MQKSELIKCWEYFNCKKSECPAYESRDLRCWLFGGTFCHDSIQDTWLEKIEVCLKCEVFNNNFNDKDWNSTLTLISQQFENYQRQVETEHENLKKSQKKLLEFKKTSIYLLKELEKKSKELEKEKNSLEQRVYERTQELKQAQAKLIQSTKMAAIGRFSAGIAHEINNPLGPIINFTRILLGNPEIKGQNRGYIESILKGLFRIENIVRQILIYSGKPKIESKYTDINNLIQESITFIRHKLDAKRIKLQLNLTNELPKLYIDPTQIQQVYNNLINNALDSMEQGGTLNIHTLLKKKYITIEFIDTGEGIEEEALQSLCEPFYTTKDVGEGTGLGLFICYNILQIYNGSLDIKSKKGQGTCVTVKLPVPEEK